MKINKNWNYIKLSFFATIILLSVVGCAVLKVDVDVYKGPMANHEDVQMQQLSVMAIGAKPLLVRLRDTIEWQKKTQLNQKRDEDWYVDGYIVPDTDGKNRFKEDLARTTNSILGLYSDQFPSQLAPLINEGNRTYAKFKKNQDNLEIKTDDEKVSKLLKKLDDAFWNYNDTKYKKSFKKNFNINIDDIDSKILVGTPTATLLLELQNNYKSIINNNYKSIINNNDIVFNEILKAQDGISKKLEDHVLFANLNVKDMLNKTNLDYKLISKTAKLKVFADGRMLEAHSKLLFRPKKSKDKIRKEFVSYLSTVSNDYVESRSSIENLLQLALKGINIANISKNILEPNKLDGLKKSASEFAYELIDKDAFFETVLQGTATLAMAFYGTSTPAPTPQITKAKFIEVLCDKNNPTIANDLLILHLKSKSYIVNNNVDLSFGIANNLNNVSRAINKIGKSFEDFTNLAKSSLDKGRLASGLETLIENYLNAEEDNCANEDGYNCAKDKLIDAMVRFAEKIVRLVNNEAIMNDHSSSKKYTLLLQSIGNSIIIQADELRHKETHDNELKKKKDAELLALNRVLARTPEQVINDLTLGLRSNILNHRNDLTTINLKKIKLEEDIKGILPVDSGSVDEPNIGIVPAVLNNYKEQIKKIGGSFDNVNAAYEVLVNADSLEPFVLALGHNSTNTGTITERIIQWHDNEINKNDLSDPLNIHFGTSNAYFKGTVTPTFDPPRTGSGTNFAIYKEIKEYVKTKKETVNNNLSSRKSSYNTLNMQNNELTIVEGNIEIKEKIIKEYEETVSIINENKADVITKASGSDVSVSPSVTFSILNDVINTKLSMANGSPTASNEGTETTRLKAAKSVLAKITPPMDDLNIESKLDVGKMNSKDVVDTLIAVLRNEHIMAIREGGKETGYANNIEAALNAAYGHRSGMVYIRPPSAYLRSSYPVTTLQDNPRLTWKNLLSEHALRVLPFSAPISNLANRENLRLRKELDKQFWHNINRVRVSGVGNTNFVLVKDDVGNWYVKRYSSDPESIIRSAQSLAMFNMGPSMGVDMISRLSNYTNDTETDEKNDASLTKIEELFVKYTNEFKEQTVDDYNFIVNVLKGTNSQEKLEEVVKTVVTNNAFVNDKPDMENLINKEVGTTATKVLDPVRKDLKTVEVSPDIKIDEDLGGETINLLYSMVRFNNVLITNIKSNNFVTGTASVNLADEINKKEKFDEDLTKEINSVVEIKSEISTKQNEKVKINSEIEKLDNQIIELSNQIIELNKIGTPTAEIVTSFTLRLKNREAEKGTLTTKVDTVDKEIEGLQGKEKQGEKKVNGLNKDLEKSKGLVLKKENELENAKQAEEKLTAEITSAISDNVIKIYNLRDDSVKDYETAIMFIGDAVNPDNGTDSRRGERSMSNRAETVDTVRTAIDRIGTLRSGGIGERLEDLRELERRRDRRRNRPGIRASSRRDSAAGFRLLGNP